SDTIPVLRPSVQELARRTSIDDSPAALEHVERLCKQLEGQQREGHWGKRERDLYQQLRFVPNLEHLQRMLDERKEDKEGGTAARCRERAQKILDGAGPIKIAALYVATFFKDPTLADFDSAVRALLAHRTERRSVPRRTVHRNGGDERFETYEEKSSV